MAGIGAIGSCGAQSAYPTRSANQTRANSDVAIGPQSVSASSSTLVALIIGPSEAGPEVTPAASSDGGTASNLSDLRQQIDQAIASALQDSSAGGSTASGSSSGPATSNTSSTPPGTPDILQTIADAISQTLQKNGVDPEKLGQRPGAHHHHHHHATGNGGSSGPVAGSDASDPSSSLSSPSSSTAGETANSATDSVNVASPALDLLQQLLEANGGGTNAGQTALQVASGGNGGLAQNPGFNNLLQLLASLPAGANVDTQV
jgi:hypothetical protein